MPFAGVNEHEKLAELRRGVDDFDFSQLQNNRFHGTPFLQRKVKWLGREANRVATFERQALPSAFSHALSANQVITHHGQPTSFKIGPCLDDSHRPIPSLQFGSRHQYGFCPPRPLKRQINAINYSVAGLRRACRQSSSVTVCPLCQVGAIVGSGSV